MTKKRLINITRHPSSVNRHPLMLAMQYSIPLPANFDGERVRERVSARRALFDDHAGLVHKSFIYSDQDHLYAPFYVWQDVAQAREFLLNDLFKGVVDAFSRHRVRSWLVLSMAYGNKAVMPGYARREIDAIPAEEKLEAFRAREMKNQAALLADPDLYLHVLALDADRWEVMRYSLWKDAQAAARSGTPDCVQDYEVLHVSEPVSFP